MCVGICSISECVCEKEKEGEREREKFRERIRKGERKTIVSYIGNRSADPNRRRSANFILERTWLASNLVIICFVLQN